MKCISRNITPLIAEALQRGRSILLMGPRQVGKTTTVLEFFEPDIEYSFALPSTRLRYENNITLFEKELIEKIAGFTKTPLVFIDEIQKIPAIMDLVQVLIDKKEAQFILSGSSARKLRHGPHINLLPGRVTVIHMDALSINELPSQTRKLESLLVHGALPAIINEPVFSHREKDLKDYATTYVEEEIRAEALVRNVGAFSRFLEIAANESGQIVNFSKLSQDIGVAVSTVIDYYQILEDCLITNRIAPITHSNTKRRLVKSSKYLFFDLGIRRICSNEGPQLSTKRLGHLFEQFVGIELIKEIHQRGSLAALKYWRDSSGVEVDYVIEAAGKLIPIEVKWTDTPRNHDARHLRKFIHEYDNASEGYIICQTPNRYRIDDAIMAIPWQEIASLLT